MEQLVEIIANNGISVVCVGFMIYFITTTLKQNNDTLIEIQKALVALTSRVSDLEQEVRGKESKEK